jgi:hypothetical protein
MEYRITNCRLCGRLMKVPVGPIMMVITGDPSCCSQCNRKVSDAAPWEPVEHALPKSLLAYR